MDDISCIRYIIYVVHIIYLEQNGKVSSFEPPSFLINKLLVSGGGTLSSSLHILLLMVQNILP